MGDKRRLRKLARLVFERTKDLEWKFSQWGSSSKKEISARSPAIRVGGDDLSIYLNYQPSNWEIRVRVDVNGKECFPGGSYTVLAVLPWLGWEIRFMRTINAYQDTRGTPEDRNRLITTLESTDPTGGELSVVPVTSEDPEAIRQEN